MKKLLLFTLLSCIVAHNAMALKGQIDCPGVTSTLLNDPFNVALDMPSLLASFALCAATDQTTRETLSSSATSIKQLANIVSLYTTPEETVPSIVALLKEKRAAAERAKCKYARCKYARCKYAR